ncbi:MULTISPECIES: glycosyltransferase family 4 protein [unclassified Aureimonas]|uniref:glycosyltransferase family 4 protein n=1 Tax=unclassified Aureimonas TaxID=2615206 RepID=UPI000700B362|nr:MULTISPECIES: glycosyltransferase family 4 protein [unclassified Aureimonas]
MTSFAPKPELDDDVRYADLAIYDDVLPSPASPFRTLEYEHYLSFFRSSVVVSLEAWHFDFAHRGMGDLKAQLPIAETLKSRILAFDKAANLVPRLAYVTFLGNAQRLLPHFEQRRIPFVLQLYPGGAFEPYVRLSDEHLRKVVHSPLCRRIITTQTITSEYLVDKTDCDPSKIEFIYGGVFNSRVDFIFDRDKKLYGRDKETIDICFVAHRYSDDFTQKGYDQFVEIARALATDERFRFHVVGDYTPQDIPLGQAEALITFYGAQKSKFFDTFYPNMDIILSPNHPAGAGRGAFDGFPTGSCMEAGFRGVVNFITDPLALNAAFYDGEDIMIINRDVEQTIARIRALVADPGRLYTLARANELAFRRVFDIDRQLKSRTGVIVDELLRDECLVVRPSALMSSLDTAEVVAARMAADHARQTIEQLTSLLNESNRYGEERHDNLFREYEKLSLFYESWSKNNPSQTEINHPRKKSLTLRSAFLSFTSRILRRLLRILSRDLK